MDSVKPAVRNSTPATTMSHLAITERDVSGKAVEWMEKVSDEQYRA